MNAYFFESETLSWTRLGRPETVSAYIWVHSPEDCSAEIMKCDVYLRPIRVKLETKVKSTNLLDPF